MTARVREAGAATPQSMGYRMPAEWEPHERTWMLWPERPDNWRDGARPAQAAWTELVRAIALFEPVTAGARPGSVGAATAALAGIPDVTVVEIDNDDAWMRDTGPTFITRPEEPRLAAMDWEFNAWGGANGGLYADWSADDKVAARVAGVADVPVIRTDGFVLEGGSIHVDGEGTLLTTEECLLNPNRNPSMNRAGIEAVLRERLSVDRVVWLPWGLVDDETDGHVDNFACFVRPGEVLLSWTDDTDDPNHARCHAALAVLEDAGLAVHRIPIPGPLFATAGEAAGVVPMAGTVPRLAGDRLAASYVNLLICNGGVVAPSFGVAEDAQALAVLRGLFPDREVVMVPGRELVLGGGNIHCLTQQQPRV